MEKLVHGNLLSKFCIDKVDRSWIILYGQSEISNELKVHQVEVKSLDRYRVSLHVHSCCRIPE